MLVMPTNSYNAALALCERIKELPALLERFVAYGTKRDQFQRYDIQTKQPIWTPFQSILSHDQTVQYKALIEAVCAEHGVELRDSGSIAAAALELLIGNSDQVCTWESYNAQSV